MATPPSEFENLQSVYRMTYNRLVREAFRNDIADDDFSTPEGALRNAMLIKDNDTATMMQLRVNLWNVYRNETTPDVYEIPIDSFDESVTYRPQICLQFIESRADARSKKVQPRRVRVSFRLMNETSETITQTEINRLSLEIAQAFPATYEFNTGRYKVSYRDKLNGYELILNPYSLNEGKELITRALSIRGHSPDWELMSVSDSPNRNYRAQKYQTILGERTKLPERRRISKVRFKRAELKIHGRAKDLILLERRV